jgi:hypothetical protein
MPIQRYKPEQIVTMLRQIEVGIANGETTPQACKEAEKTMQTFYRWRKEYGDSLHRSDSSRPLNRVDADISCRVAAPIAVAVGTTIADRPPHRSVQARLRIRLLPWMGSGEACIRVGLQNAGLRNPPGQDWGETSPSHLCVRILVVRMIFRLMPTLVAPAHLQLYSPVPPVHRAVGSKSNRK